MKKFTTVSQNVDYVKVIEPITISETKTTRCIFRIGLNSSKSDIDETVDGTLIHQRKSKNDTWEDISESTLSKLKAGEGIKYHFKSEHLKKLYEGLSQMYALANKGIELGERTYYISDKESVIDIPQERVEVIKSIINKNYGNEVWNELISTDCDLATKLSLGHIQNERTKALNEFENMLINEVNEDDWQKFFSKNEWIFGYGLKYIYLKIYEKQPNYGGTDISGKGAQRGDFLTTTSSNVKFTVLVEIKKANTKLFKYDKISISKYRNGAAQLSEELIGAISQIQINCNSWQKESISSSNIERLVSEQIHTINPVGILIIGNSLEYKNDKDARNTFEAFRISVSGIDIITYDELYNRAKFIIENN